MPKHKPPTPAAIRKVREQLGLTQPQAATLLETSIRTFRAWEGGETKMQPIIFRWFAEQVRA